MLSAVHRELESALTATSMPGGHTGSSSISLRINNRNSLLSFVILPIFYSDVLSTNSSSDHSRSLTPAAIAGVTRKVLWTCTRL